MFEKIKKWFTKEDDKRDEMILQLAQANQITNNHLIALARLMFIKPETLLREAKNLKSNAEYLLALMDLEMKEEKEKREHAN